MPAFVPFIASAVSGTAVRAGAGAGTSIAGRIGSAVAMGGRMIGLQQIMATAGVLFNPANREFTYHANWRHPNVVPEVNEAVKAYYAGRLVHDDLATIMNYNGCQYTGEPWHQRLTTHTWNSIVDLARPFWDLSDYFHWWKQGRLGAIDGAGKAALEEKLDRAGFANHPDRNLFLDAYADLQPEVILNLWLKEKLAPGRAANDAAAATLLKVFGYREQDIPLLGWSAANQLPPGDLMALRQRGFIDDAQYERSLGWHGLFGDDQIARLNELRKIIPPVSDQLSFLVRDAWDDGIAAAFGYDQDYPDKFTYWADKVGLNWGEGTMNIAGLGEVPMTWPRMYWRAKWYPLSPQQGYEALHRLRGDPNDPATWRVPGVRPFTNSDLDYVLKIHDYAPGVRDWLRALSFLPLRLVDIRRGVVELGRDRQWAIDQFMDRGSAQREAEFQADLAIKAKEKKDEAVNVARNKKLKDSMAKEIVEANLVGWKTNAQTAADLRELGWRTEEIQLVIQSSYNQRANDTAKQGVQKTKQDFLTGRVDAAGARRRLALLGIQPPMINTYMVRWGNMRSESYTQIAAAKAISLFKEGLINGAVLNQRLVRLGYSPGDAALITQMALIELLKLQGKAQLAEQKAAKAAAAELQALLDEAAQQQKQWRATIRRLTPVRTVQTWYAKGIVNDDYLVKRFSAMGFGPGHTAKYHEEAAEMRMKWLAKNPPLATLTDPEADVDEVPVE